MAAAPPTAEPIIRFATEEDVSTILALIHELAAYEHATDSVHATPTSLLNTLSFPSNPQKGYAKTLLIYPPSPPPNPNPEQQQQKQQPLCAGFALYYTTYSTWRAAPGIYLEDLFVRPEFRGRGYGTALLRRLAKEVTAMGGERLEWSVLKWNEPSLRFYEGEGVGAKRMDEWVGMRVEGDGVGRLAGEGGLKGGGEVDE